MSDLVTILKQNRHSSRQDFIRKRNEIRRDLSMTDNKRKKNYLMGRLEKLTADYANVEIPRARSTWDRQLKIFRMAEQKLETAEKEARAKIRKEASAYVAIAQVEVSGLSQVELNAYLKEDVSPAEAYARQQAARGRTDLKLMPHQQRDDFHTTDKNYQTAYKQAVKTAEETEAVQTDAYITEEMFSDVGLSMQLQRFGKAEVYEAGELTTFYTIDDDPTDFRELIQKSIRSYGGE